MKIAKPARGFAAMDPARQRLIAQQGGKNVPNDKRSFSRNSELAATAGRKGNALVDPKNRSFAKDRKLAAEAGRKGGLAMHRKRRTASDA